MCSRPRRLISKSERFAIMTHAENAEKEAEPPRPPREPSAWFDGKTQICLDSLWSSPYCPPRSSMADCCAQEGFG